MKIKLLNRYWILFNKCREILKVKRFKFKIPVYFFIIFCITIFGSCENNKAKIAPTVFHAGNSHTGVYDGTGYKVFDTIIWKFKSGGKIFSSPAIANDVAYTGCEDGNLYAIEIKTGKLKWKYKTGGAVSSSPAVNNNIVYFCSYDGNAYALDATTGDEVWKFKTGSEHKVGAYGLWTMKPGNLYMEDLYDFFLSSPVVERNGEGATIYFGSSDSNVYALDAGNGNLKWKFKTKGIIHTSPALENNTIYIGSWDTYLYAIDATTGKEKWKFKTKEQPVYHLLEGIQGSPAVKDSFVYFGARDGYFYAVNANSGSLRWKIFNDNSWVLTTPAIKDGIVYYGTSDTYLLVGADAKTGKEKFRVKANGYIYSSPVIAGQSLFFGDFTGQVFDVDLNLNGKERNIFSTEGRKANAVSVLNKKGDLDFLFAAGSNDASLYSTSVMVMDKLYSLGPILSSPVIKDNALFFGSADSCLYAVHLKEK